MREKNNKTEYQSLLKINNIIGSISIITDNEDGCRTTTVIKRPNAITCDTHNNNLRLSIVNDKRISNIILPGDFYVKEIKIGNKSETGISFSNNPRPSCIKYKYKIKFHPAPVFEGNVNTYKQLYKQMSYTLSKKIIDMIKFAMGKERTGE